VHLARATDSGGLNRIVAVKVLKERWTSTTDVLNRTRDEAQLLASLQHQNIVRVEAITEIDGLPAIIMEFVHGIDLSQLLQSTSQLNQKIPHRAVYEIAECIASALAAAWFKVPIGMAEPLRVVHRDIKPSNVMISTEGELRVLDFGTARFEDASRIAKTEAFRFGSVKYMSPERKDGARGQHPADVYSLGLVVIELLGGRIQNPLPLSPEAHDAEVLRLIDAIPSFGLPNTGWDNSLRETLTRLCASDPENRLDARQTVKLMRAFKQQSTGDGLVAYAEDVVASITETINAIPEVPDDSTGQGTRFALEADGKTSVLRRSSDLRIPDELITQELDTVTQLSTVTRPTIKDSLPPDDDPTQPDLQSLRLTTETGSDSKSEDVDATARLTVDPHKDLRQEEPLPSSWNPKQNSRAKQAGPQPTPGQAKRLPPTKPANQPDRTRYLAMGCAIAVAGLVMIASVGGAAWWFFNKGSQPSAPSPNVTPSIKSAAEADAVDGEWIEVSLHAGDPTVQWIRLTNAEGTRVLTAKPDGTASIPPAEYELSVKVVARSVLKMPLDLNSDTTLTCKPSTMGRVRCMDRRGGSKLILRP